MLILIACLTACASRTNPLEDIVQTHQYYNQFEYIAEEEPIDYWKTPEEFIRDGGGDCEDFAIAKYEKLKYNHDVVILEGFLGHEDPQYHATLLVDGVYILDNNDDRVLTFQQFITLYNFVPMIVTNPRRFPQFRIY